MTGFGSAGRLLDAQSGGHGFDKSIFYKTESLLKLLNYKISAEQTL